MNKELIRFKKFPEIFKKNDISQVQMWLDEAISVADAKRVANLGLNYSMNIAHHLPAINHKWVEFLQHILLSEVGKWVANMFDSEFVLNNMSGVNNDLKETYLHQYHKDFSEFDEALLAVNVLILLDPFTMQNGATEIVLGLKVNDPSRLETVIPTRLIGQPGDVFAWDSRYWHRSGRNFICAPRRAVTMLLTRPFIKPQFNYSELCKPHYAPAIKSALGYNHRVPSTLDEWYRPVGQRFYKR